MPPTMRLLRIFSSNAPGVAWKSKPSWYIVANNDRTVHPELQRFVAKRMGASTHAIDSSHVPMLSWQSKSEKAAFFSDAAFCARIYRSIDDAGPHRR
jgi:hypothetical protein